MLKIGLDFDNNLISYDKIFYKVALEENLIPKGFPEQKVLIRDFLRKKSLDHIFTQIQAEVYGKRILEASPCEGVIDSLIKLKKRNVNLFIVSHKTLYPYNGPKYNLHNAANEWLNKNGFFDKAGLNFSENDVYFEISKLNKIKRISLLDCTHFIDDLPEILDLIEGKCIKILYNPFNKEIVNKSFLNMKSWHNLNSLISHD
jgi:hypothetical protein